MNWLKKAGRILLKTLLVLLVLVCLLFTLVWSVLKFPAVQNFLVSKATHFLSDKTNTRVELGRIDIAFPKSIVLENLFLEDLDKDTLVYVKELEVDIDMLALIGKKVEVNFIGIEGLNANLKRRANTGDFNFQFIVDAFASKDTLSQPEPVDTTASPWEITASTLDLKNCAFAMHDSAGGIFLETSLEQVKIEIDKLDLKAKGIALDDAIVRGLHVDMQKTRSHIPDTAKKTEGNGWDKVVLGSLLLDRIAFSYKDWVDSTRLSSHIKEGYFASADLSLANQTIKANNVELKHTVSEIALKKQSPSNEPAIVDTVKKELKKGWLVNVDRVFLQENNLQFDYSHTKRSPGFDGNHFAIEGFGTEMKNVFYEGLTIRSSIKSMQVQERNSGFGIKSFQGDLKMDSSHIELQQFDLMTNHSRIGHSLYTSFASFDKIVETMKVKCTLQKTQLAVEELLLFAPQLKQNNFLAKNNHRVFGLDLNAEGSMKKMVVRKMNLRTSDSTTLSLNGTLQNLKDPTRLFMDVNLNKVYTTREDLAAILPDSMLPSSIALPAFVRVTGKHKGTMSSFITHLAIHSSFGNASVDANIKNLQSKTPNYDLALYTPGFHVGDVIKQNTLGKVAGKVTAKGQGFDKDKAKAELKVDLASIGLQNYTYRDIKVEANVDHGIAKLTASVNDSNVAARINGDVGFLTSNEYCNVRLHLMGMDLYQLKMYSNHMQVSAVADVALKGNDMSNLNGHLDIRNILIVKNNKEYKIDSLVIATVNEENKNNFEMSSSLLMAKFNGNIDLLSIAPTVTAHINQYFEITPKEPKQTKDQNFEFEVFLNESPLIKEVFLPDLNTYDPISIKGGFNSVEDKLWMNMDAPLVEYSSYKVKNIKWVLDSDKDKLAYDLGVSSFFSGSVQLEPTSVSGQVRDNTAQINLQIKDSLVGTKLGLQSLLTRVDAERYRYSLVPNGVSIKGQAWDVSKDNFIEFGSKRLYINQFGLHKDAQSIMAQSSDKTQESDLTIKIDKFHLHSLSQLVEKNDSLFKGTIDGGVVLKDYQRSLAFTSNIAFTDLQYKTSKIGNLYVKADNLTEARYSVKANLEGMGNDVLVSGYFAPNDKQNALNFKADIKTLQLLSIESFTSGQIAKSTGAIRGAVTVTGTPSAPIVDGTFRFEEARTKVQFLNEFLYMKNETIEVNNKGVHFPSFTLRDTLNNTAVIDGWVYMKDFKDFRFDLDLTTKDFLVLNTTAIQNKMYYGKIIVDSDIHIEGTPELPKINAKIALVGGSRFTYTIPESRLSVDRGDGVMVFLYDASDVHPIMLRREPVVVKSGALKGIDLKAKINVDPETSFKLLLDPTSGDSLVVRGDANLNFGLDPSGKMSLSGSYIITGGKYKVYLENVVTKEFLLENGSRITWNGEPLDATVDITARYVIKTSPRELMTIGTAGAAITDSSLLARPILFNVYLMMRGELLKPVISFRLGVPENQGSAVVGPVTAKINEINQQEAELNKQVFSLLVLSRFMAPSASGGGGGGASGVARSSVSKLLSDQLNTLSQQYLKGVELDFDMQSYQYSQGGKTQSNTQLNVGAKKSFDRFTVQVGTNVQLEGQRARQQNTLGNLTGDVQVGYKLTKDGRYQLKAFRQNQVDGVVNGIIVETGVGLLFNRDFTTGKELFSAPRKPEEEKKK